MKTIAETDYIVNLAPMECIASSLLTYLKRRKKDIRFFLLHYWNLTYNHQVLMSGKNPKSFKVKETYGVQQTFHRGNSQDILRLIREDKEVILLCRPEKLHYFPRNNLIYDSSIFKHAILIYKEDEKGDLHFIDPTEEYIGTMPLTEVEKLATDGSLYFYSLEEKKSSCYLKEEAIHHSINDVYKIFINHGLQAFTVFLDDFHRLPSWELKRREHWILQNNVTISAIVKTRKKVWSAYRDLGVFPEDRTGELEILVQRILKHWLFLNFSLLKYKKNQSEQLQVAIHRCILELKEKEGTFVRKLKQFGDEIQ